MYTIDKNLEEGMKLLAEGKRIDTALDLINKSAKTGTTKGKSYFEIGRIIREGIPSLYSNPEESRRYYDEAMNHFLHEPCDAMDHREMGDYFYYGLGTEPANKNRALEYYDLAASEGDTIAKERAQEIRNALNLGAGSAPKALPTQSAAVFDAPVSAPAELEQPTAIETPEPAPEPAPVEAPVEAPAEPEKPAVVVSSADLVDDKDEAVQKVIDENQVLIEALRILDSDSKEIKLQDKFDAADQAEAISDNCMRAAILCGFLCEGDNMLVEEDLDKAKEYYEKAYNQGSSNAAYRLGILYTDPRTSYHDADKGHELILEAAHKGNAWALCFLGDCFREKVDDVRNLDLAYQYYALAGERGLALAFHNMAEIDASRQQLALSQSHEKLAREKGFQPELGYQDPVFYSLHI